MKVWDTACIWRREDCLHNIDSSVSMVMHASGPSTAPVDWRDSTLTLNTSRYGSDLSQLRTSNHP